MKTAAEDSPSEVQVENSEESIEEVPVAPVTKTAKLTKVAYMGNAFAVGYPLWREEFFSKVPQEQQRKFNRGTFSALCLAVHTKLSKDSDSTGRKKIGKEMYNYGRALMKAPYIPLTFDIKEAVEYGYGVSDRVGAGYRHRQELVALIETLDSTPIDSLNKKGKGPYRYLCKDMGGDKEEYEKTVMYLYVNAVFGDLASGFGAYLDDTVKKLAALAGKGENTGIDRELLFLLVHQDHRKPFKMAIDNIFAYIGRAGALNRDKRERGRALDYIERAFKRLEKVGVIAKHDFDDNYGNVIFYFKPPKKKGRKRIEK